MYSDATHPARRPKTERDLDEGRVPVALICGVGEDVYSDWKAQLFAGWCEARWKKTALKVTRNFFQFSETTPLGFAFGFSSSSCVG
jgi:hypothetical protein